MRSNIARTCPSSRVPAAGSVIALAKLREEVDEVVELLGIVLLEPGERGHRRRGIHQRSGDRLPGQSRSDLGQVRARAAVPVLADLVAGQAAGLRRDELPGLVSLEGRPLEVRW